MKHLGLIVTCFIIILFQIQALQAQTTGFTYQGSLINGGIAGNGNFDFEFALFGSVSGGVQFGSTITLTNVIVTNSVFSVRIDFGSNFLGGNRFLEIRVRPSGGGTFTILTPRQRVDSAPYSIQSINASQLGGVAANQYLLSGAATINAATQFNIGTDRVFSIGGLQNTYVGVGAGAVSSPLSERNSFFGNGAGQSNTFSGGNSFFGMNAGNKNTSGGENSFFGAGAGENNTTANSNSFYGVNAGSDNLTGGDNAFFGRSAGSHNTTGGNNSYFGVRAGLSNTTSINNSFFGFEAGKNNTAANNSFFGVVSGAQNTSGTENSFFGRSAGGNNTTGNHNSFFGRDAGVNNTTGDDNVFLGYQAGNTNTTGDTNTIVGSGADVGSGGLTHATAIGAGAIVSNSSTVVLGRSSDSVLVKGDLTTNGVIFASSTSNVRYSSLSLAGDIHACVADNNVGQTKYFGECASSIRFKTNVSTLDQGIDLIKRLRPVAFDWISNGQPAFGLIAEEVDEIEPILTVRDLKGEVQGVQYDRVTAVLINAVKEQQAQIESQQKLFEQQNETIRKQDEKLSKQQSEIDALKTLVCLQNPTAPLCQPRNR